MGGQRFRFVNVTPRLPRGEVGLNNVNVSRRALVIAAGLGLTSLFCSPSKADALPVFAPFIPAGIGAADVLATLAAVLFGVGMVGIASGDAAAVGNFWNDKFSEWIGTLGDAGIAARDTLMGFIDGCIANGKILIGDITSDIFGLLQQFTIWLKTLHPTEEHVIHFSDGLDFPISYVELTALEKLFPTTNREKYIPVLEVYNSPSGFFDPSRAPLGFYQPTIPSIKFNNEYIDKPLITLTINSNGTFSIDQQRFYISGPGRMNSTIDGAPISISSHIDFSQMWVSYPWARYADGGDNPYSGPLSFQLGSKQNFVKDLYLAVNDYRVASYGLYSCIIDLSTNSVIATAPDVIAPSFDSVVTPGFDVIDGFAEKIGDTISSAADVIGRDYTAALNGDIVNAGSIAIPQGGAAGLVGAPTYGGVLDQTGTGILTGEGVGAGATTGSDVITGTGTGTLTDTIVGDATGSLDINGIFNGTGSLAPDWFPEFNINLDVFPFNLPKKLSQFTNAVFSGGAGSWSFDIPIKSSYIGDNDIHIDISEPIQYIKPVTRLGAKIMAVLGIASIVHKSTTGEKSDNG